MKAEDEIKKLKQKLIVNYKKGHDGKRRNCLGSIESTIEDIFENMTEDELFKSYHQSKLQALKKEVEELYNDEQVSRYDGGRNEGIEEVLNLITKLEDNG